MRSFRRPLTMLAMCLVAAFVSRAQGQGLIVDRRHHVPIARSFEVREVTIDAQVRDQLAEVQITQTFHNPNSFELESEYLFPLPDGGAVQNFVFLVDGKELPGRLLPKAEARRIYEEIVRSKRDPALLEYMGQGLIRTSVFPIPPQSSRTVTMRYTLLCERDRDVVEFTYPLSSQKYTAKPIARLGVTVRLDSKEPIKSIYVPGSEVEISRDGDHRATIRLSQRDIIPTVDFRLLYTLSEGAVGASVLSMKSSTGDDGYFLVLASPEVKQETRELPSKTVIFVLDRSGSMTGRKIEQARNALKFVLDNLREGDTFNILTYDDRVETFKPELQSCTSERRAEARRFVENIQPGGSTNIDEALRAALAMVTDPDRPSYILFLTDGLPTAGQTDEAAIAENARRANKHRARLFAFGVGEDVNARLLDRLSGGNSGTSEYVRPNEDIEATVSRFFRKLTSPVLANISLRFEGRDLNRTYPRDIPDLFEGGQIVWVGRYREGGETTLHLEGKIGGETRRFSFPATLARTGEGSSYQFVETLWAARRVGFLIDQIDLHGQNRELVDELVELSKKHGILTPYTSFLADERVNLHASAENARRASEELVKLSELGGASGVSQRAAKGRFLAADGSGLSAGVSQQEYALALRQPPAAGGGRGLGGQTVENRGLGGFGAAGQMMTAYVASPAVNAAPVVAQDSFGRIAVVENVRRVGSKTFFRKGEAWIDSALTDEQEQAARRIEQFSDAYFELARKQSAELNQYLTFEEPVVVLLDGVAYSIVRPAK